MTAVHDLAGDAVAALLAVADGPAGNGWLQSFVAVAVALSASYFAYRQATRVARISADAAAVAARVAAKTEAQRIEAEAYQRAQGLVDAQVARQTAEMEHTAQQLAVQRTEAERLRQQVSDLQDEVARLRRRLIVAGLDDTPII